MKKKIISLLFFGFGLLILGTSILRSQPCLTTMAMEMTDEMRNELASTESAVEENIEDRDYDLPYPGILPDHPLYFLKMVRDRVQLFFTSGEFAKANLLLQYADKRIAASLALAEKGKTGLAVSTAVKAEFYMQRAMNEAEKLSKEELQTMDFYKKAFEASDKHAMVLMGILSRLSEDIQSSLTPALEININERKRALKGFEIEEETAEVNDEAEDGSEPETEDAIEEEDDEPEQADDEETEEQDELTEE